MEFGGGRADIMSKRRERIHMLSKAQRRKLFRLVFGFSSAWAFLIALPSAIPAQQPADVLTPRLQWKHDQGVTALTMSPDGKLIATAGQLVTYATATTPGYTTGEVRLWNAQTGAHVRSLTVENDKIASLIFSPDSKLLAAGGGNEQLPHDSIRITVWDV